MKCLITGGTGFVGSAIANRLADMGHEVLITGTQSENTPSKKVHFLPLNLQGIDWLSLHKIDVVFHQAAINDTRFDDRKQIMLANVDASRMLFELLRGGGCRKFVYASSTAIYGDTPAPYIEATTPANPQTHYAESKLQLEEFATQFGKDSDANVVGLRYCNVYGPGEDHKGGRMSMIGQMLRTMRAGKTVKLFKSGEQRRDWIYVQDVVDANLAAVGFEGTEIFNCGSGKATSFNDILKLLWKYLNVEPNFEYVENPYGNSYQSHTECNMEKAKKLLGFEPKYDIIRGIQEYIKGFN